MSCSDSKKLKQVNNANQSSVIDEINIHSLNDDCLMHIFQYLSIKEKLDLEDVCLRWNSVSKLTWISLTSLQVDKNFQMKYLNNSKVQNTTFIIKVLIRCNKYLNKLNLDGTVTEVDYKQIFKKSVDYLKNITDFGIKCISVNEDILQKLFKNNQNLKNISLKYLKIDGSCLLNLNPNSIEVCILDNCVISSKKCLKDFFSHLKNIKVLELNFDYGKEEYDTVIEALIVADAKNVTELSIQEGGFLVEPDKLHDFLSRQKQLRKIHLDGITKDLITHLSIETLEEISSVDTNTNLFESLKLFKNLKIFRCVVNEFSDRHVCLLSKNINLRELSFEVAYYGVTPNGENYFSSLENLESLQIELLGAYDVEGSCNSLQGISKCKKLKKLLYKGMSFTINSSENIEQFPSLEIIDISYSNIKNEILSDMVLNSPKLNYCRFLYCENVNNVFIDLASKIKNDRKDSHILTIEYDEHTNIKKNDSNKILPLICLKS